MDSAFTHLVATRYTSLGRWHRRVTDAPRPGERYLRHRRTTVRLLAQACVICLPMRAGRGAYLDEALAGSSGHPATDEVYGGPSCVPGIVDDRAFRRLAFRAPEHGPDQQDVRPFLAD